MRSLQRVKVAGIDAALGLLRVVGFHWGLRGPRPALHARERDAERRVEQASALLFAQDWWAKQQAAALQHALREARMLAQQKEAQADTALRRVASAEALVARLRAALGELRLGLTGSGAFSPVAMRRTVVAIRSRSKSW